jgi:sugar phosphate permease
MSTPLQRRRATKPLAIATGVLVLLFAALPTTTLLAVAMAPTLGAFIGDTTPRRYLTKCVAGMNLAGTIPFLHKLWTTSHDMATAIALVTDLYVWLSMYSAAAVGWLLFLGFPGVVAMVAAHLHAARAAEEPDQRVGGHHPAVSRGAPGGSPVKPSPSHR